MDANARRLEVRTRLPGQVLLRPTDQKRLTGLHACAPQNRVGSKKRIASRCSTALLDIRAMSLILAPRQRVPLTQPQSQLVLMSDSAMCRGGHYRRTPPSLHAVCACRLPTARVNDYRLSPPGRVLPAHQQPHRNAQNCLSALHHLFSPSPSSSSPSPFSPSSSLSSSSSPPPPPRPPSALPPPPQYTFSSAASRPSARSLASSS